MSYDLHVERCLLEEDETDGGIALDEWLSFASGDPELRVVEPPATRLPDGRTLRTNVQGAVEWTAHPGGRRALCSWRSGRLQARGPDPDAIVKLRAIAKALGAHLRGDEGESYDEPGG